MKILKYIILSFCLLYCLTSCNKEWDDYYGQEEQVINNDNIEIVNKSAVEFIKSNPELSSMYNLFDESDIISSIIEKDILYTILVVENSNISNSLPSTDKKYLAKSHISDISLSPSNLFDGQRILMWNGKYINVSKELDTNNEYVISFNGTYVKKITKVNNGYIYELEEYVSSPKSMYEIIEDLGDDYSIFQNMILSKNQTSFDRDASIPIGVDNTGSTIYDSVFTVTNPYFIENRFDILSESLTATMLMFSNEVIENALSKARSDLAAWNIQREDSVLNNWILEAAFFDDKYSKQDFIENEDLISVFDKQWRTTVQKVDLDNPLSMSNGVAYEVTEMKIPTNVLIYRVKDYMKWYELLSNTEKDMYFDAENLTYNKTETQVGEWTAWPGVFPNITNRVLMYNLTDPEIKEFTLNFTGISFNEDTQIATPYKIPPGEYDLCLGFKQKLGHDIEIFFNDEYVSTITASQLTSTTFHYDRGGQGYPEGYDTKKATGSKTGNYDRDGGKVGTITITGTELVEAKITFHGLNVVNGNTLFHHWTLKPTMNCY